MFMSAFEKRTALAERLTWAHTGPKRVIGLAGSLLSLPLCGRGRHAQRAG
jgi:hypothetical protein